VAREITGADRVNAMAACAGGFTLATLLGHLAAAGDECVGSATLLVTVLDTEAPTMLGQFASKTGVAASIEKSRRRGVSGGQRNGARVCVCNKRPSGCSSPIVGRRPPAFDILTEFRHHASAGEPADCAHVGNPLKTPGDLTAPDRHRA
jgi:polyhydroxyalkanoate synthase